MSIGMSSLFSPKVLNFTTVDARWAQGTLLLSIIARKSVSKSLTRKRQRSGSFRQSFQLSSLMGNPRPAKIEGGKEKIVEIFPPIYL